MTRWSVALATHNGARFLEEQLASLLDQERRPDEIVAYDDGSTDGSVGLIESFAATAPIPVRVVRGVRRQGSDVGFGRAVSACSGELVALADQDDVWHPEKLATLDATFEHHPRATLVFSDAAVVDASLRPTGQRLWETLGLDGGTVRQLAGRDALPRLLRQPLVTGATAAVRRWVATLAFPMPTGIPRRHDGWLAVVAAALGPVEPVAAPLIDYRQHPAQQVGISSSSRRLPRLPSRHADPAAVDSLLQLCAALLERLEVARGDVARSTGCPDLEWAGESWAIVSDYQAHLRSRRAVAVLPALDALRLVARETRSGHYSRWSSGGSSALADALRTLSRPPHLHGASEDAPDGVAEPGQG